MDLAIPTVDQRWPGPPTSPLQAVWPAEAPNLQFAAHGSAGGVVALHNIQVRSLTKKASIRGGV